MRMFSQRGLPVAMAIMTCMGCGNGAPPPTTPAAPSASTPVVAAPETKEHVQKRADEFLKAYFADYSKAEKEFGLAYWAASNSGKKEDFEKSAALELAMRKLHSEPARYEQITELLTHRADLDALTARSLEVAELTFKGNQLPSDLLEKMVKSSSEIEQLFTSYRGKLNGKEYTNNELLDKLAKSRSSKKRQEIWEALKQVGASVGPRLVALAKIRNEAAHTLGYANYWEMQVRLQEHDPVQVLALFDQLDTMTAEPFKTMKAQLDGELAKRFEIKAERMMPWHYDNPFFQDAPPSAKVDLDDFYKGKKKEEVVEIAKRFYADIGLPLDALLDKSDLYDREGKDQHAFCIAIDREGDVRTLLNVKPDEQWMGTMLHEEGHAVYYKLLDYTLPYNLRESAHILTTEAIAMMFGALSRNPEWMVAYAGADAEKVKKASDAIREQRRREQLIFARWGIVMLRFEKAMYENPEQDLNKTWWDIVEKTQLLSRPKDRNAPDWASKPHFTIAPVYYHNYLMGEVFAAQMRATLAKMAGHQGSPATLSFNGRKDFGEFLTKAIFRPGMRERWPAFVKNATGEELTPRFFAEELK